MELEKAKIFRKNLLEWYHKNKRPMPWRETNDPYHIWVSEVMLQQTQVATVIDYFNRFIKRFPDIKTLSEADEQDVLKLWEGLGYYSRARNFHNAAKQLIEENSFEVPNTPEAFLKLSGVGPYTCAAVQSIAFGKPMAVVDGNVKRVLSRLYKIETQVNDSKAHTVFEEKAQALLDTSDPSSFNQAMMELGALICKPSSPDCSNCPVIDFCISNAEKCISDYPRRKKKKPVPTRKRVAVLIQKDNTFLILKRNAQIFLGGMWELPNFSVKKGTNAERMLKKEIDINLGIVLESLEKINDIRHAYTHFKLEMQLYYCSINSKTIDEGNTDEIRWITLEEIDHYPFHKAIHKCFPDVKKMLDQ